MGNFMSCVLICGAMEVVQVVNTNGRVEKLIRPIRAAELIWAHERYKAALAAGLSPSSAAAGFPVQSLPLPPAEEQEEQQQDHHDKSKNNDNNNSSSKSQEGGNPATANNNNKFVLLPLDPSAPATKNPSIVEMGCRAYKFQCLSQENVSVQEQQQQIHPKKQQQQHQHQQHQQQQPRTNHHRGRHDSQAQTAAAMVAPSGSNHHHHGHHNNNPHHQPFRVKKEGGVTTLVVSKRYLEHLLSEKEMAAQDVLQDHSYLPRLPNVGSSSSSSSSSISSSSRHHSSRRSSRSSSSSRVSIWRPALESISEQHNHNNHNHNPLQQHWEANRSVS